MLKPNRGPAGELGTSYYITLRTLVVANPFLERRVGGEYPECCKDGVNQLHPPRGGSGRRLDLALRLEDVHHPSKLSRSLY